MIDGTLDLLLIEDDPMDATVQTLILRSVGCRVSLASSVVEGEDLAMAMLATTNTQPVGIVTDLKLRDLILSRIEGSALAAVLAGRMLDGLIRPAPIIAITSDMTDERRNEALSAGCTLVLSKPLRIDQASQIYDLTMHYTTPTVDPVRAHGIQLLRGFMEKVLSSLRENRPPTVWTAEAIFQILCAVTSYSPPRTAAFALDPHKQAVLVRSMGGSQLARELLERYALMARETPAGRMIALYLEGYPTNRVIHILIDRGYAKSYLYRVNEHLPELISKWIAAQM
ncbi:MAG TPA: hypothetical protein VFZ66_27715 [Herpetosiphonaceae bacterium]